MPILMEPSPDLRTPLDMQCVASDDDDEDDYSFSLSDLPEEESALDPALLSTTFEDSISFSFSTENPSETECAATFGFPTSMPLLTCYHAGTFESSSVCDNIMRLHVKDEESASLVPFKISGSWRADSSVCKSTRHAESRCSFSFLTDMQHEAEELVRDSSNGENAAIHEGGKHEETDDNNMRMYSKNYEEGDADRRTANAQDDDDDDHARDDDDDDNGTIHTYAGSRFAGKGLLQPWSSSKLSKSSGAPPVNFDKKGTDTRIASRTQPRESEVFSVGIHHMQSSESEPYSPRRTSFLKGSHSPTHTPLLYMPQTTRKTSSLFARRVQNAGETLSLLVNAQRPVSSFVEAAPSPASTEGSGNSSSYRNSSNGSTQSSGYSSPSGKSSTPTSRNVSRNASSLITDTRCTLRQRMDAEALKSLRRQGDSHAQLRRKDAPNAQLCRKGDPSSEKEDSCMYAQAHSKAKTDRFVAGHGRTSPSCSPTPRSPLSWRSVLSLQPLNPSHVPLDEWELLGKPSSRSYSQRSRSSSRGSSSRDSKKNSLKISASTKESLSGKKGSSEKGGIKESTEKMVKSRRGYWPLNPMQWFWHCRNEKQVVDTCNLGAKGANHYLS